MSRQSERRPTVAAMLSFLQPGVGHLYLREWFRAVLWAGLWAGSFGLVTATAGVELGVTDLLAVAFGLFAVVEGLPTAAVVSLFAVTLFATLDAYWLAAQDDHKADDSAERCPDCGKDLDPSLEFCHWCTARLEDPPEG